jgi:RNA-directed DNA polymerase
VRYADDIVVGFEHKEHTQRFQVVRERLAESALELHPQKTRLIGLGQFAAMRVPTAIQNWCPEHCVAQ